MDHKLRSAKIELIVVVTEPKDDILIKQAQSSSYNWYYDDEEYSFSRINFVNNQEQIVQLQRACETFDLLPIVIVPNNKQSYMGTLRGFTISYRVSVFDQDTEESISLLKTPFHHVVKNWIEVVTEGRSQEYVKWPSSKKFIKALSEGFQSWYLSLPDVNGIRSKFKALDVSRFEKTGGYLLYHPDCPLVYYDKNTGRSPEYAHVIPVSSATNVIDFNAFKQRLELAFDGASDNQTSFELSDLKRTAASGNIDDTQWEKKVVVVTVDFYRLVIEPVEERFTISLLPKDNTPSSLERFNLTFGSYAGKSAELHLSLNDEEKTVFFEGQIEFFEDYFIDINEFGAAGYGKLSKPITNKELSKGIGLALNDLDKFPSSYD